MIVYKDYFSFLILNQEVNLISDETDYGLNTIAEIENCFYYLGDKLPDINAAVLAWQNINNKKLTPEDLKQILIDNHLGHDIE